MRIFSDLLSLSSTLQLHSFFECRNTSDYMPTVAYYSLIHWKQLSSSGLLTKLCQSCLPNKLAEIPNSQRIGAKQVYGASTARANGELG